MKHLLLSTLLPLVLPVLVGALSFALTQLVKRVWADVDAQPAAIKQGIVAAWAFLLNALTQTVGHSVCSDGAAFCNPPEVAWSTVLSFAIAAALHGQRRGRR